MHNSNPINPLLNSIPEEYGCYRHTRIYKSAHVPLAAELDITNLDLQEASEAARTAALQLLAKIHDGTEKLDLLHLCGQILTSDDFNRVSVVFHAQAQSQTVALNSTLTLNSSQN